MIDPRLRQYRWARGRRQRWIAVSDHARDAIARLFDAPPDSIERIYNGVEISGNGAAPSRTFGGETLLSVGRLVEQKGHADLVPAVARLARRHPRICALVAGDGPERDRLRRLIDELRLHQHVRLLGHVTDVPALHRRADLFVFPSRYEGTPFAMLEAMASGLPVVAATFGSAREVVEHGAQGLLVEPGDVEGLADAIDDALTDRARLRRMGDAAAVRARAFSREAMVQQTLAVLSELAR
jgi:glycosyltransferase involved in cell wall biosynthesis